MRYRSTNPCVRVLLAALCLVLLSISSSAAAPVITNCPWMIKGYLCDDIHLQLTATPAPGCEELTWSVTALGQQPVNGITIDNNGLLSVTFTGADGGQLFNFRVIVSDNCGAADTCMFPAEVLNSWPFLFRIGKLHTTLFGRTAVVPITAEGGSEGVAGFDFLISYEACILNLVGATPGSFFRPDICNWEYFTYNPIDPGIYDGLCRLGLVRLRAVADLNNGDPMPYCYNFFSGDTLATMSFYLTHDYERECEFSPIRFAWQACGDNTLPEQYQNYQFGACRVFDAGNTDPYSDPNFELTDTDCSAPLRFGGDCGDCDTVPSRPTVDFVYYWNGGIELQCLDPICKRGDLNLNGIAYEIGDAEIFVDYFLYGLAALDPDPGRRAAQICASDINDNGVTLEVADLVSFVRIFVNDTLSIPPEQGLPPVAQVSIENGQLLLDSPEPLAAVYATFGGTLQSTPTNHTLLPMQTGRVADGSQRVLWLAQSTDEASLIPAGKSTLSDIGDNIELLDIRLVTASGQTMTANLTRTALPGELVLDQNFPNPFNPTTRISFQLPTLTDWQLQIVNVAGQQVKSFGGRGSGDLSVEWDARDFPSGVYLYRLTAGSSTVTRKMMLMK